MRFLRNIYLNYVIPESRIRLTLETAKFKIYLIKTKLMKNFLSCLIAILLSSYTSVHLANLNNSKEINEAVTNVLKDLEVEGLVKSTGLEIGSGSTFTKFQAGKFAAGTSNSSSKTVTVNYPTTFSGTTRVIAAIEGCCGFSDSFTVNVNNSSNGSFTAVIRRIDGTSWGQDVQIIWFAWSEIV